MEKSFKYIALALVLSVLGAGALQAASKSTTSDEPVTPRSGRIPVAVDRFKTENISVGWWNDDIALNSRETAVEELVNNGKCVTVLEREEGSMAPVGVMNEKALARSDEARPGAKAAKKRQMKTAENLVSYALTGYSRGNEGFNAGGLGGAGGGFGGLGGGFKKDELTLSCKVIDTTTSEILASSKVKAGGTSFNIDAGGGGIGGGAFGVGGLGYFKKSKVGQMMTKAIHECTEKMVSTICSR